MTCFTKEKTKVQWGEAICPKMGVLGWMAAGLGFPDHAQSRDAGRAQPCQGRSRTLAWSPSAEPAGRR